MKTLTAEGSSVTETLEQVLADERGQAAVLRHNGHVHDAELLKLVRVQWRERGRRRTPSWQNSPRNCEIGKAYAHGVDERLSEKRKEAPRQITLDEMWRKYFLAKADAYLEWRDVDLERGLIHYRPELDKMGHGHVQPLSGPVVEALWVVYGWRTRDEYEGPFVFYGAQDRTRGKKPWTYQVYSQALREAERRAGVQHKPYRAAHGFRRGAAGNVVEVTGGDLKRAATWIGDKSVRVLERHYLKERYEQMHDVAERLAAEPPAPKRARIRPFKH